MLYREDIIMKRLTHLLGMYGMVPLLGLALLAPPQPADARVDAVVVAPAPVVVVRRGHHRHHYYRPYYRRYYPGRYYRSPHRYWRHRHYYPGSYYRYPHRHWRHYPRY